MLVENSQECPDLGTLRGQAPRISSWGQLASPPVPIANSYPDTFCRRSLASLT